ncbi:MAG: cation:proton antiporter regulatory subunit [Acidimicrobiia bacterium]|nr:cation:proton antiporter regulatory subunit [Acidimicrobiia bacterium]
MAKVQETLLPGVGVRYEFTAGTGVRIGVISRFTGERDLLVFDSVDPDRCVLSIELDSDSAHTLIDLLGGSQVSQRLADLMTHVEGLAIEQLTVGEGSELAGRTLAESQVQRRTQASVIAVIRDGDAEAAPGADFRLEVGDLVVALGMPDAVATLAELLA